MTKISTPLANNGQANGDSSGPVISADGSTIIFSTNAVNLVNEPPAGNDY
ncbi:PD40 domain-containing protein [Cohnella faecalis]|nr:PD40 domain-containing protein [Cohnella faecalis]